MSLVSTIQAAVSQAFQSAGDLVVQARIGREVRGDYDPATGQRVAAIEWRNVTVILTEFGATSLDNSQSATTGDSPGLSRVHGKVMVLPPDDGSGVLEGDHFEIGADHSLTGIGGLYRIGKVAQIGTGEAMFVFECEVTR